MSYFPPGYSSRDPECPVCGDTDFWEVPPPYGWPSHVGASSYPAYFRCACESLFVVDLDSVDVLVDTQTMPDCPLGWDVHGYGFVVPLGTEDAYYCQHCHRAWYDHSPAYRHLPFTVRLEDGQYLPVPVPPE